MEMDWITLAEDFGFDGVCALNMESLQVLQAVRDMCSAGCARAAVGFLAS